MKIGEVGDPELGLPLWLDRNSVFTLYALLNAGYREEAAAWRQWLMRAAAGNPAQLQIMLGRPDSVPRESPRAGRSSNERRHAMQLGLIGFEGMGSDIARRPARAGDRRDPRVGGHREVSQG